MTDLRPIEEDLHAYVDGRLETERRGHVEQYLGQHPEAKSRIQG
jgi:anti-sigma factor RsiW